MECHGDWARANPANYNSSQLMACKLQLIDTSDTFLDNSSSYLGAMPYLAQMMGIATPSSGRQIDILVGK